MSDGQIVTTVFYLGAFIVLAYITRARGRRMVGAAGGGAVAGFVALCALLVGEAQGWWRVSNSSLPHFRSRFWLSFAVSWAPVLLITWRVARNFAARGLALCGAAAAIAGPAREYTFAAMFPAWSVFSSGATPVLAVATAYALMLTVGHAVMRLVAGPAGVTEAGRVGGRGAGRGPVRSVERPR